ncbi:oligosaccharide flippase family protein [Massilia sp. LC238]|uniref:oligosaccharide flippase family protein n=1 Tax=Massilia sp. LC238 TaxID=1502852 RepID=UPI0004E3ACA2|nr:oligosaccharide flippase family protein [Massilia sp. LC238]KFC66168.1 Export protein [Massilia sp. LC238]
MADLRRSLVINFFSSSGATLMRFVVSILLARILSPAEIGVYSMTVVFVNLAGVFRDFGVSTYLQREPDLTPDKIRSATGVVFTSSWLIAIAMFLSSESIGNWFQEPEIIPVMQVLSIGFLLIPFGAITNALLTRELAAEKQAIVNMAGTLSFCVSCVVLAKLGHGSLSLAYANLINIIVCAVALVPLRPKNMPWLPSFDHWRSVTHFGLGSLLSSCMVALNNAIPDLLLGKLGNARQVGLLSRANSTVTIFTHVAGSTVSYGAVSYMAQAHHRGESLVPVLTRATSLLTGVGWTALALTTVLGRDIVLALYGEAWLECVPAILPLSVAAGVMMAFHYVPIAVTAIGRPYLSAAPVAVTLLARIGFAVVLFDGTLAGFGWVLTLATLVAAPVTLLQQQRYFGFGALALLRALLPSAFVTAGTTAVAALLALTLPSTLVPLVRLLLMFPVLALAWYLLLRASGHPVLDEVHRLGGMARARLALLRPNV